MATNGIGTDKMLSILWQDITVLISHLTMKLLRFFCVVVNDRTLTIILF
jgi:hypothetical protein